MAFKLEPKRITSWSPSKLSCYEECPRKAKYKYIDKIVEPQDPNGPLARGSAIHKAAEDYITHRVAALPDTLQNPKVKKLLALLRKDYKLKKVRVEMELAFTKEWKMCGWLAQDVYCRFKVDVVHLLPGGKANLIDWKTGKFKPDGEYDDQLAAYAVGVLSSGLVKQATAQLMFTDVGEPVTRPAGALDVKGLAKEQKRWDAKARAMLSDTTFPCRPGNACRWCFFSTNKGGPCEF